MSRILKRVILGIIFLALFLMSSGILDSLRKNGCVPLRLGRAEPVLIQGYACGIEALIYIVFLLYIFIILFMGLKVRNVSLSKKVQQKNPLKKQADESYPSPSIGFIVALICITIVSIALFTYVLANPLH